MPEMDMTTASELDKYDDDDEEELSEVENKVGFCC